MIETANHLDPQRSEAIAIAQSELALHGFIADDKGVWNGAVDVGSGISIPLSVVVPAGFPHQLPKVFVDRSKLPRRIPHVEPNGSLCIARGEGVLLDAGNPSGLVSESLERATRVLSDGLSGANEADFIAEFLGYWNRSIQGDVWSLLDSEAAVGSFVLTKVVQDKLSPNISLLAAHSKADAERWLAAVAKRVEAHLHGFFLPLVTAFVPPDFDAPLTVRGVRDVLKLHSSPEAHAEFDKWLASNPLPSTVLFGLPPCGKAGRMIAAVRIEKPVGELRDLVARGFRPGHVPMARVLRAVANLPVTQLGVTRIDAAYLAQRGGTSSTLGQKTVAVVGCGAVGSALIEHLAAAGFGHLRLIDHESLTVDNVHRHTLGMADVGRSKAEALAELLARRFPHLGFEHRFQRIEKVLESESNFVEGADLILVAIGDETTSLLIENALRDKLRLHVWVEPLGLGGHVVAAGVSDEAGCYQCLFRNGPAGLFNYSAFAAAGQTFTTTVGGCGTGFVPFGRVDATRAAIEATTLAVQVATGAETENVLVSWQSRIDAFVAAGFSLSERGKYFKLGDRQRTTDHARRDCPVCGREHA